MLKFGGASVGRMREGRALRKGVLLPCKHLLSAFYGDTPPSKNPSKNSCPDCNPYKASSKNPSKNLSL